MIDSTCTHNIHQRGVSCAMCLEAENAKLRSGELKSVMRINAENAKLKHRVDEVEARNLDLFVSEAELREIMQELVDDYAVGPIERTKIQAALK
jgi:hypothetical protein